MLSRSLGILAAVLFLAACATKRQRAPAPAHQQNLNHPADRDEFVTKVQEGMRSGQLTSNELTITTKKGEVYVVRPHSVTRVK